MALPTFAAARRAAATPAVQQSVDISYTPGPQQQTRRTLLRRVNGTDRRDGLTDRYDGRTSCRCIDPAPHNIRVVPVTPQTLSRPTIDSRSIFTSEENQANNADYCETVYCNWRHTALNNLISVKRNKHPLRPCNTIHFKYNCYHPRGLANCHHTCTI